MIAPEDFKNDVKEWARVIGVEPKQIHLRKMKRKLASCSSKGRLTFDPSLLIESKEVRSKAILHELLHLRYPNHGKMFHILLDTYLKRGIRK
ncbi:MAG: M48 family metallopeptidase [Thermoplasmata archaeon]|nr:M48 family metallopeptidase [Thermoplasmata archaeon]